MLIVKDAFLYLTQKKDVFLFRTFNILIILCLLFKEKSNFAITVYKYIEFLIKIPKTL